MTEIGQIKREIAFHGDVINTASRIQSQCSTFEKEFLISEELFNLLSGNKEFDFIGDTFLKGKNSNVKIYAVNKEATDSTDF
ncbi:hypothetical protein GBO31_23235 [Aquimarina litoralis]|nr:hypothetical protein [Aquimarina litoralis]